MRHKARSSHRPLTRRTFLRTAGLAAGGLLAGKSLGPASAAEFMTSLAVQNTAPRRADATYQVAIGQAEDYDIDVIREQVFTMIEQLGGLDDVVHAGDRVAIKTNLTGGTWWEDQLPMTATEIYITHPAVTRALTEAVLEAGAREVLVMESIYDLQSWSVWGNTDLVRAFDNVKLINLNDPAPYDEFGKVAVGPNWLIYDSFNMHPVLQEVDVFMSVAKMKCHAVAGVTLGMKNLFGTLPADFYKLKDEDNHRSALHGPGTQGMVRVPSVIVDLARTRPIDFVLLDGVKTAEGSEGPWNRDFNPKTANVLVAGKNMVATDAVGTAVMGFDPTAPSFGQAPFRYCLNHLQLAAALGLGTVDLSEIEIVGAALEDVVTPFRPYRATAEDMRTQLPDFPHPYPHAYGQV